MRSRDFAMRTPPFVLKKLDVRGFNPIDGRLERQSPFCFSFLEETRRPPMSHNRHIFRMMKASHNIFACIFPPDDFFLWNFTFLEPM